MLTQRDREKEAQGLGNPGKMVSGWHQVPEIPRSLCPGSNTQAKKEEECLLPSQLWGVNPGFPPTDQPSSEIREARHPPAD